MEAREQVEGEGSREVMDGRCISVWATEPSRGHGGEVEGRWMVDGLVRYRASILCRARSTASVKSEARVGVPSFHAVTLKHILSALIMYPTP